MRRREGGSLALAGGRLRAARSAGGSLRSPAVSIAVMPSRPAIPGEIEEYRDQQWRREATRQVETVVQAEQFVEQVGFAACLTDSRRPGPSLYVAVCGRRDAVMPRNVQKDEEASLTWRLKDEVMRRGKVYYAKLARGKAMFLAPRLIPCFHAVWGMRRKEEAARLSANARAILAVLRREWELGTSDLREASRIADRAAFTRAMDELQAAMIVVPSEVVYVPKFTYIWTLGVSPVSGSADPAREAGRRAARDRARVSLRRRPDDSRRARAGDGSVAAGGRARQPRAGGGRLRDDAGRWRLSAQCG